MYVCNENSCCVYCNFVIANRIFQVGTRVFSDGQVGGFASTGMTYPDFIFFMLSEEDKSSESALKYWSVLVVMKVAPVILVLVVVFK